MFKEFFQRQKEKRTLREWQNSNIGKILATHTQKCFTEYPRLAGICPETKEKIVGDFYQKLFDLSNAENPFLAIRKALTECVLGVAELQVLCLTEEEKAQGFYRNCSYISGQLHYDIDKAVNHVEALRELKGQLPNLTNEELVSFCNLQCAIYLYHLNGLNYVRVERNDTDEQSDWLRPFIESMMIWHEDMIREKMGLPSLLPNELDGFKHSTFMNGVVNGYKKPYYEWKKHFADQRA